MITLKHVSKTIDSTQILVDINLVFEMNHLYLIKGISGSGKSTLLNIIGLIDTQFEGSYYFKNEQLDMKVIKKLEELRHEIGYIFQESLLFSSLTVLENLTLFSRNKDYLIKLCKKMGIEDQLDKLPNELSNGQRQRVSIVRSIIAGAKILLADEPTAALDKDSAKQVAMRLNELSKNGYLVIVCSHDDVFDKIADQCIRLDYGVTRPNDINSECKKLDVTPLNKTVQQKQSFIKEDITYSRRRYKKTGWLSTIIMALFIFIILSTISLKTHLKQEYTKSIESHYPAHVYALVREKSESYKQNKQIEFLPYYALIDERQIRYEGLFNQEDSSLAIKGALSIGYFPKKSNEIIVNEAYLSKLGYTNQQAIGLKVKSSILNVDLTIVGVLNSHLSELELIYQSNRYYQLESINMPTIFVPIELFEQLGIEPMDHTSQMVSYPNHKNDQYFTLIFENTIWKNKIEEELSYVILTIDLLMLSMLLILIISYLFIHHTIKFEIFMRKKEIGYLKLFGMSNKRVTKIIFFEYFFKVWTALIIGIVIYSIVFTYLLIFQHLSLYIQLNHLVIVLLMIMSYIFLLIILPVRSILKNSIISLIRT